MADFDPLTTQRDLALSIAAELSTSDFEDIHVVGQGGFGIVYRCRQPSLDRTVAIKVLTSELDSEDLARFVREQRAMGRLSGHPNIVNVFEVGTVGSGRPFIVMQYHSQGSLENRIRTSGPLAWNEVLRLGVKMAGALETAHRMGILHRDVKPGNILLTDYVEPQLTDFGIAHISGGFETSTGTVTGSPAFTAPEVLKGESPTAASDVYSLGATLFCAITGHAAFERLTGEHVVAQFLRIATEPVPEMAEQGIPDDVRAVVGRAMAGSAADRPASAEELGELLRDAERRHYRVVDEMALPTDPTANSEGQRALGNDAYVYSPPAARTKDGNLPLELTSFVGRRHELAQAKQLLSTSRLVTLTGVGGVGKTRLALRVAEGARRAFGDGVWLIELGELADPGLLVDRIAAGFGLQERSVRPPLDLLTDYLAHRQILMVLDNCEHLIDAVAQVTQTLLRTCPDLRIIATSREPLGIGGEIAMRVPPLAVPHPGDSASPRGIPTSDAITLFVERAHAAVPEFELTEDNRAVIAQICERLDGLPLPIELAAVRLRVMSAPQILDRLADRYSLLTVGSRGAPTRQQTMRLSVDWSYELCTPREQQLWKRLSVFVGGFELDAAEGACGGGLSPTELLDTIALLTDKSILIREEHDSVVRFRMLEILREYGREKLQESGEWSALRRRHRDWFKQLVMQAEAGWISNQQLEWIARLRREQPNLREALEFCVTEPGEAESGLQIANALHPFWFARGLFSQARSWIERALAPQSEAPTALRTHALCTQSMMAGLQGDLDAARSKLMDAEILAKQLGGNGIHAINYFEGNLALYSGEPSRAADFFEGILEELRAQRNPLRLLEALSGLGLASWLLQDHARAVTIHEEVLAITRRHGESVYQTYSLWGLGLVVWNRDDPARAVKLLKEGVRLTRNVNDPVCASLCVEALAWISSTQHQEGRAARLMGAAGALRQSVGGSTVHIPGMVTYHRECTRRSRQALGDRAYEAAFQQGKSMTFEGVVAYVLDEAIPSQTAEPQATESILTRRESQVAELVAAGMTNRAIAAKLVISQRTAQGHVEHILQKLGFTSRAQIAAWFIERGVP
ncbi:protein kinase [Rhodococcus sp. NPDC057529]|uniref:protein kinase domain-containing protein n=1 Tax=Rhodococcus sp. NPDC057529 TaxID=3346158 RepID=UPI00366AAFC9